MKFERMEIRAFLDELASDSPAPGGGSVAALCASLGSALVSMVANLTIGKEKYKDSWQIMEDVVSKSESLRFKFVDLMNKDTESFNSFMAAMKLPKATEEEKCIRKKAMGEASKLATEVPLLTLEACVEVCELAYLAAKDGNTNTISDAGSAALISEAAGRAAAYNVKINLPGVTDESFAADFKARMKDALKQLKANAEKTTEILDKALQ
ncbi:MAG TPA: methenyltetrahydrofolate cyclohydrolase [Synergistaceae bacterium]|jgi:methenyltetrahydrofolate cyclohydrolase|uniref:cyclodeaminase/cyclohydrolase family protein n=1 Tax=Synergistaceae TaxID=649777 RepID=UPI000EBAA99E|nr:cyclodeaminase/cyclohydrolase family protein [Synergistaceae bacterium DZ-S4]HAH69994.1 methenyltetrahydrofolate cyclohydrolase [Synergistaceae bacterium]